MKTLRGHPPRNISDSGVIYLDSDGEDSDYSDSEVEPVFFPAAGFDFNGEVVGFELQDSDNEVVELDSMNSSDEDDDDSLFVAQDSHDSLINVGNNADEDQVIIQFIGGTVQVRHIVNENFAQLQQELRETHLQPQLMSGGESAVVSSAAIPNPSTVTVGGGEENSPGTSAGSGVSQESSSSCNLNGESTTELRQELFIDRELASPILIAIDSLRAELMENQNVEASSASAEDKDTDTEKNQQNPGTPPKGEAEILSGKEELPKSSEQIQGPSSSGTARHKVDLAAGNKDKEPDQVPVKKDVQNRINLKRKEPEGSGDEDNADGEDSDEDPQESGKPSRKTLKNSGQSDEEEETCNPMVSEDEDEETEDAFRGDRIGTTVYSERHVLKILMKWIEVLPSYSIEKLIAAREDETVSDEVIEKEILRLNNDFEEQMALLWDMSSETDVMSFLLENKIFAIIRNTIENSVCNRLIEVSLGILANVISEPSIIEDFAVHDSSLQIVEKVVELCAKITDVAVLIQAFSVLRRIVWYLRTVGTMKKWTDLLLSPGFLECSNFIMSSSTNALLLGNVIMLCFTFLDSLKPDTDEDSEAESEEDNDEHHNQISSTDTLPSSSQKREKIQRLVKNYEPFCAAEFVPALCEGLKELMKHPRPSKNSQRKLTSTRENPRPSTSGCQTDEHCPNADEIDIPIPEGHVQQAILKGLSALTLLKKVPNGQNALKNHAIQVVAVLLDFYRNFSTCTEAVSRSNSLEYFALSLHLLSLCHCHLDAVNQDAILFPVSTASKLMNEEERDEEVDLIKVQLKDGAEVDSVSYIALVVHEYLASITETFGADCSLKVRNGTSHAKLFARLDKVVERIAGDSGLK